MVSGAVMTVMALTACGGERSEDQPKPAGSSIAHDDEVAAQKLVENRVSFDADLDGLVHELQASAVSAADMIARLKAAHAASVDPGASSDVLFELVELNSQNHSKALNLILARDTLARKVWDLHTARYDECNKGLPGVERSSYLSNHYINLCSDETFELSGSYFVMKGWSDIRVQEAKTKTGQTIRAIAAQFAADQKTLEELTKQAFADCLAIAKRAQEKRPEQSKGYDI